MNTLENVISPGARFLLNGDLAEVLDRDEGRLIVRSINTKGVYYIDEAKVTHYLKKEIIVPVRSHLADESVALQFANLSGVERHIFEDSVFYIRKLYEKFYGSLPRKKTMQEMKKLAAERDDPTPPKYTTLYTWMRAYRNNGKSMFALMKVNSKKVGDKKLPAESLEIMRDYINKEYLTLKAPPGAFVYDLIVAHIEEINRERLLKLEIPSAATFYRTIKDIPIFVVDRARLGNSAAARKHKYGTKILAPERLLARVEGDTQEIDVMLLDAHGRSIGRPYLTCFIDVMSGALIGWFLSMTPPCFEKTAAALRHALTERTDGSPAGLMEELVVDNGSEFYNSSLLMIANRLCFDIRFCTKGEPDQKPFIESFYETLNTDLIHSLDGTTKSNPTARGRYDSEKEATLTLEQLQDIFEDWVHNCYHLKPHGDRYLPTIEIWKRNLDPVSMPTVFSRKQLEFMCLASHPCRINKGRVRFLNLAWTSPSLSTIESKLKLGQCVEVLYDRSDLGTAWVHVPKSNEYYQVDAVSSYQYGLSMYEHDLVRKKMAAEAKQFTGEIARATKLRILRAMHEAKELLRSRSGRPSRGIPTENDTYLSPENEVIPDDDADSESLGSDNKSSSTNFEYEKMIKIQSLVDAIPDESYETFTLPRDKK